MSKNATTLAEWMPAPVLARLPDMLAPVLDQPALSPLFPLVWLSLPVFFAGCLLVWGMEGSRQRFNPPEAVSSLLNSVFLGAMMSCGPLMNHFFERDRPPMTAWEVAWKLVFFVLVIDTTFYWLHRAMHEVPLLRRVHLRHHARGSKHTVWGGLDEDWEETISIVAYLTFPMWFVSVTPEFFTFVMIAGAATTALIHGSVGTFPPWPLVDARFHHAHHMYFTKNFSANFLFWDSLMGTRKDLPVSYPSSTAPDRRDDDKVE